MFKCFIRLCVFALVMTSVSGCVTSKKSVTFSSEKYGVPASPRVIKPGKPVPRGGGRHVTGKPYKVAGKYYTPRASGEDYKVTGLSSWYGPKFHGRLTANGEIFDQNALSAAHPTLPLPSYVRVTNQSNRHSLIVRVNDRGPFHGNRVIDLSKRAADILGLTKAGVGTVEVEYLGPARLDGRDTLFLMASYRPFTPKPSFWEASTQIASLPPSRPLPVPHPHFLKNYGYKELALR